MSNKWHPRFSSKNKRFFSLHSFASIMSVSKICEPLCKHLGDHCPVSKKVLHITAAVIWFCGIVAVNTKLIIYMDTVTKGKTSQYDLTCLPDSNGNNRTWIPFVIGAFLGIIQIPYIYRFVRRNYTRIELLNNNGFLLSQHKSCYECYFLSFLVTIIMLFVIMDELLCGKDNYTENHKGAKCVFIGLDSCVGLFLFFGFAGFITSYFKGPLKDDDYAQLIRENDASTTGSNNDDEQQFDDEEQNTVI